MSSYTEDALAQIKPEREVTSPTASQERLKSLPPELQKAAARWKVNPENVSIAVLPLEGVRQANALVSTVTPLLEINANKSIEPASTEKLVTTLVALETLDANYHWMTGFYTDGTLSKTGILRGNLYIRGGGDPTLVVEDFSLALDKLKALGVRDIRGNVVIDRSFFDVDRVNPGEFDGRASRPYNVGPDAALLNYKNISMELIVDADANIARVVTQPPMSGVKVPSELRLSKGACGDWKGKLKFRVISDRRGNKTIKFEGALPKSCGDKVFNVAPFERDEYFSRVFRALWTQKGNRWSGKLVSGVVSDDAVRRFVHVSPSIVEVIGLTNKWSNNVMARHLFLTTGQKLVREEETERLAKQEAAQTMVSHQALRQGSKSLGKKAPSDKPAISRLRGATLDDARAVVNRWLTAQGIDVNAIHIDNGSGLSRDSRVTARAMAQVLAAGWKSPYVAEYVASLPIAGIDGTMRKRQVAIKNAHIKTGYLQNVRSIGGYVYGDDGQAYAVYATVEGADNMPGGIAFLDNVIKWVYERPSLGEGTP